MQTIRTPWRLRAASSFDTPAMIRSMSAVPLTGTTVRGAMILMPCGP